MKRAPSGTDSNLLAPPRKAIQTFELPYSESAVRDLREGLARTRWPDTIPGSGWEFGFDLECLQSICRYWREKFDRKAEVENWVISITCNSGPANSQFILFTSAERVRRQFRS